MSDSQEGEQASATAEHARGPEHLVKYHWPKGYCPNPSGRPKGSHTVAGALRQILDSQDGQDAAALALNLVRIGKSEDPDQAGAALSAIREILERGDGKVDKGIVNKGEPTVVVINGPKPLASQPESP